MAENNKGQQQRKIVVDPDVKEFAKANFKKFKKREGGADYSKKEIKKMYNAYLLDLLPETIKFCVRYGHINQDEIQNLKNKIYEKFIDDDFIKLVEKEIKKGEDITNIKLFPIVVREILAITDRENKKRRAEDPNAKIWDLTKLADLSALILKKKIKKMTKAGIESTIAFDICSIIPTDKALLSSQHYRIKEFYAALYEIAKGKTVPFEVIMEHITKDSFYLPAFVLFALLEKKDRYSQLTDAQKDLYINITNWSLKTLESFSKQIIEETLTIYIKQRKKAESQGNDSRRRYDLQSLSEVDYPKISKVIKMIIARSNENGKYL